MIDDEKVTVRAICGALGITFHPGRNSSYYLNAIYKAETQAAICTTLQFENTQLRAELEALRAQNADLLEALEEIQQALSNGDLVWKRKRTADSDPYHPANIKMCAALAKAQPAERTRS